MTASNSTIIKHLDANLNLVQRTQLNHSGNLAYWYNGNGSLSLCFGINDQKIKCVLLDYKMKVETEVQLTYGTYLQYYSIFRARNSGAVVLTIQSKDLEGLNSDASYVQHIGLNGTVSKSVKFQESICENVFEMITFEMRNGLFCACAICRTSVNTKCIGSVDEREF